ncbi:MAG: hypothetical protein WA879_11950, partial [Candidatus Acidiferrales bacterium]
KYNILGSWKCCQSVLAPSRTIMALVKAANVIEIAATPIQTPVSDRSGLGAVTVPGPPPG